MADSAVVDLVAAAEEAVKEKRRGTIYFSAGCRNDKRACNDF